MRIQYRSWTVPGRFPFSVHTCAAKDSNASRILDAAIHLIFYKIFFKIHVWCFVIKTKAFFLPHYAFFKSWRHPWHFWLISVPSGSVGELSFLELFSQSEPALYNSVFKSCFRKAKQLSIIQFFLFYFFFFF